MRAEATTAADTSACGGERSWPRWLARLRRIPWTRIVWSVTLAAVGTLAWSAVSEELATSRYQSEVLSSIAAEATWAIGDGPSDTVTFPSHGPYDHRLGYTQIARFTRRLQAGGFVVSAQTRQSPRFVELVAYSIHPPYEEPQQAGLTLLDHLGMPLHDARYPSRIYPRFEDIPPVVSDALLYIEDRALLTHTSPRHNPAVAWGRLATALAAFGYKQLDPEHEVHGASTLATQLEKFRHSPEGRTAQAGEKLRQMASAALRAYRDGPDTRATRREIVRAYLNGLPLGAASGYGEVFGIGDGLWAWYGADFDTVNAALMRPMDGRRPTADAPLALRQVIGLLIAQRRPAAYLIDDPDSLDARVDAFVRVLREADVIPGPLGEAALSIRAPVRRISIDVERTDFVTHKAAHAVRAELLEHMGVDDFYTLDRLDLAVATTLDREIQDGVTQLLRRLADPAFVAASDLAKPHLLDEGDPAGVVYSFTLYERTPNGNALRVQADTWNGPFDLNGGARLELGSTAKLRTLATYLEVVAELHARFGRYDPEWLAQLRPQMGRLDRMSRWALRYLARARNRSLEAMLDAALRRRYSADSKEHFFTGGGIHRFHNFKRREDRETPPVAEALARSINLVFVRMMRDVADYHETRIARGGLVRNRANRRRSAFLQRFADSESLVYLERFQRRFAGLSADETAAQLVKRTTNEAVATIFTTIWPAGDAAALQRFVAMHRPDDPLDEDEAMALIESTGPGSLPDLADRAHISGVHPLALWLAARRAQRGEERFDVVARASAHARMQSYGWLLRTSRKHAQDRRIETVVERDAFTEVHASWVRHGFPFDDLVPSYGTALGSSGDRPAALAELLGIIASEGVRRPVARVERLHFAAGTPFETVVDRVPPPGRLAMTPAVARALRRALEGVVQEGTGRHMRGVFTDAQGLDIRVWGKTGTGDNQRRSGPDGEERTPINRTATFAFGVGDDFFGVLTAYVPGAAAEDYTFTSGLPIRILALLEPVLRPLIRGERRAPEPLRGAPPQHQRVAELTPERGPT